MTIDEPVLNLSNGLDQGLLLEAVVAQLRHVNERLTVLEQQSRGDQVTVAAAPRTPTQANTQMRRHDPHTHRQTGWQPRR